MHTLSQPRLFATIQSLDGRSVLQSVHKYADAEVKLVRQSQQLTFNLRCKHWQIIPPTYRLRVKALVRTPEGYRIAEQTSSGFLCARIGESVRNIKNLRKDVLLLKQQTESTLGQEHYRGMIDYVTQRKCIETG